LDVLQYLLSLGAGIDKVMYQDHLESYLFQKAFGLGTPLHEAARLDRLEVIDFLAAHGASPLIKDSLGKIPLEVARKLGNAAAEEALRRLSAVAPPPEHQFTTAMARKYGTCD